MQILEEFSNKGGWLFLDNIHLMSKWLPTLEGALEGYAESAHEHFRVFLAAEPHPDPHAKTIPQGILESSLKIINMPPSSLKSNMIRAFNQFSQQTLDRCNKPLPVRSTLFGLCFFHACVVGRHRFGSLGWSRSYSFNYGDLTISASVVVNYLDANEFVPWADIKYIIGEVMYGGHITDNWDRRCAITYLDMMLRPGVESLAPGFEMPPQGSDYDSYARYIVDKFPAETPELFGLHSNADLRRNLSEVNNLFSTILELQGIGSSSGSSSESAASAVGHYQGILPVDLDVTTLREVQENSGETDDPYMSVLLQVAVARAMYSLTGGTGV